MQFDASARSGRSQKRPSWWKANWAYAALVAAPVAGVGGAWVWNSFPVEAAMFARESVAEQFEVTLERCSGPERITCVVDGDTFWLEGTKIRIADINTPEVSEPKCAEEAMLGERATDRLVVLLSTGGFSLETIARDEDAYGRKLRIVTRGGESVGEMLIYEGLAERWTGSRRNWC